MDDSKNEKEKRGIRKDNSKGIDTKEAIGIVKMYKSTLDNDICNKENKELDDIIELLQRGEINQKIIDKMKNEKYDVWISLPGSFTNIPKFVRDVEKEVIK